MLKLSKRKEYNNILFQTKQLFDGNHFNLHEMHCIYRIMLITYCIGICIC